MGFWDSVGSAFTSGSGQTNWGAIIGGVLATGSTIYAAQQQKKMQQEQYKQQQNLYNQQVQYQQDQISAARSTPIAQLAPIFMETLINAYSGKLSKYGINLPVGEMLGILGRGGSPSGAGGGTGSGGGLQATMNPEEAYGMSVGPGNYKKAQLTDFNDAHTEAIRNAMGGYGGGTGRLLKNPYAGDTSIQDAIWNQEVGQQGMLALGGGGGGAPQLGGGIGPSGRMTTQLAPGVSLTANRTDEYMNAPMLAGADDYFLNLGGLTDKYGEPGTMAQKALDMAPDWALKAGMYYAGADEKHPVLGNIGQFFGQQLLGGAGILGKGVGSALSYADQNPYAIMEALYGSDAGVPDAWWNMVYGRQ